MKQKAICVSNKFEFLERFSLYQTYHYEKVTHSGYAMQVYYVYLDDSEWVELFEMDFDEGFLDLAIYRGNKIIEILTT